MKQKLQLRIPEPCQENWNNMTATQRGRFCISCQNEVVDFSVMTDNEILQVISKASGQLCGRVGNEQLNRELIQMKEPAARWLKYWLSVAASFIMLFSKSNAQIRISKERISCLSPGQIKDTGKIILGNVRPFSMLKKDCSKKNYVVNGMIKDEAGNPVPGASVIIKDTRTGVVADEKGMFRLRILRSGSTLFRIMAVGYEAQDLRVDNTDTDQSVIIMTITLREATTMGLMGEVVKIKKINKKPIDLLRPAFVKSLTPKPECVLKIYPNPAPIGSTIKIIMDNALNGNYTITIYDMDQNMLINKEIMIASGKIEESSKFDQRFNSGMYLMRLTGNNKNVSAKFIIL